jgi:hypothetical protein
MKKLAIFVLLALELGVCGCGSGTNPNTTTTTASGSWEAQLTGGTGSTSQLNFVTTFSVTDTTGISNEPLSITGFSFFNAGACFTNGVNTSTEAGTATLNASSTGSVTGTMAYTVTSVTPSGNVLTLNGTNVTGTSTGSTGQTGNLTNGVVTGNWYVSSGDPNCSCGSAGSPCGNFIMCQGTATCTQP